MAVRCCRREYRAGLHSLTLLTFLLSLSLLHLIRVAFFSSTKRSAVFFACLLEDLFFGWLFGGLLLYTTGVVYSVHELGAAYTIQGPVAEGEITLAQTYSNTSGLFEAERTRESACLTDARSGSLCIILVCSVFCPHGHGGLDG